MKKFLGLALLVYSLSAAADQVTFTGVNFDGSTFSASAASLQFANVINVLVTDNSTGKSVMLLSVQSGNTGGATDFVAGPPLIGDYLAGGAGSVLIASGGHTFLSGMMADSGRLEADWPNSAGAFLSRFDVSFVDPGVLADLGLHHVRIAPEGSVSLTVAETAFDGTTLHATLGGSQITIETEPIPETATLLLTGSGLLMMVYMKRRLG